MICIDCDTEITGNPVCRATRSAVRWRVPVSSEGIAGSGIRCTAARVIRVRSRSMMIAPSILASSRRPVAVNGTSSVKPPVQIDSTVRSWPSTISAPVRPRRIRSRPSRSAVPGAIAASVARMRIVSSFTVAPATGPPLVGVRRQCRACSGTYARAPLRSGRHVAVGLVRDHVQHGVDQGQVGERLREVAEVLAAVRVDLLGVQLERAGEATAAWRTACGPGGARRSRTAPRPARTSRS